MADIDDLAGLLGGVVNHLYEIRKQLDRIVQLLAAIEKKVP